MELTAELEAHLTKIANRLPEYLVLFRELGISVHQKDSQQSYPLPKLISYVRRYEIVKHDLEEAGFPVELFMSLLLGKDYLSEHPSEGLKGCEEVSDDHNR